MFKFLEKSDLQLSSDVQKDLEWDRRLNLSRIKCSALYGVLTLKGSVSRKSEIGIVNELALKIRGVRAVVNALYFEDSYVSDERDGGIAWSVVTVLGFQRHVPSSVKVSVRKGIVTLSGRVEWDFQREASVEAIKHLTGVRGLKNRITLVDVPYPWHVRNQIMAALEKIATDSAASIVVEVIGSEAKLSGVVHSIVEKNEARYAAWTAPGIRTVVNDLEVRSK